tara:strand:+ start:50 stop:316 length:267 start_codon:yes stop_codon:yes gene_type:complete
MKDKIKNTVLSVLSTLVERLLGIKTKIINMIEELKVKILDSCDDVSQMVEEGSEELTERFGSRTFLIFKAVLMLSSFACLIALITLIM